MSAHWAIRKIENNIAREFESAGIHSVLVAVSGGADSVALLCCCSRISSRLNLRVEAVNCNFHLRGEESDRDSEFTGRLCKSLGIELHALEYDVEDYIKNHPGMSTEMACRELRYADFVRICRDQHLDRIAVAHNSDDDIETMILNMLRGSGSRGLRGMDADNGRIIRPLLGFSRKEIESYLSAIGQDFITDSSNLTSDYRRNFIRRNVLPLLESRWPGARKSLSKTLSIMKEESDILESHYRNQLNTLCPDCHTLLVYAEGVTTGIVLRFIEQFGGNAEIAGEILDCLDQDFKERKWILSDDHEAVLERDRLIICDVQNQTSEPVFLWEELQLTAETMVGMKGNRDHHTVYLPSGKEDYIIRRPQKGDRIAPMGMRGTRLVSDIISDARLERSAKSQIRVLVRKKDGEIIWVTGLKRSRHDLIKEYAEICYKVVYNEFEPTYK